MTDRPLNVAIITTAYPPVPGGVEVYAQRIAESLVKTGCKVRVLVRFTKKRPSSWKKVYMSSERRRAYSQEDVSIHVVAHPFWMTWLAPLVFRLHYNARLHWVARWISALAYRRQLVRLLGDVDIVHYSGNGQEMLGVAALNVARKKGIPFVVTPHTHAGSWGDGELDFELYKASSHVIALTADERSRLIQGGVDSSRVTVIPHAAESSSNASGKRFRTEHDIAGSMVFFLGRKSAYKGYSLLLDAAPLVWERCPDTTFVFAGASDPALDKDRFTDTLNDARIRDLDYISDDECSDAYAAADVVCVPSSDEAFGLVYLEAWAYAKPVVALRIPTLVELIEGAGGGILVERTKEELAKALTALLEHPQLRSKLGQAGYGSAGKRSWKDVALETVEVYSQSLHPSSSR